MSTLISSAGALLLLLVLTAVVLVASEVSARIQERERAATMIRQIEYLLARSPRSADRTPVRRPAHPGEGDGFPGESE